MVLDSSAIERVGERLSLVGTIHVDPASATFARDTILRLKPEVVALELDEARLSALQNPGKPRGRPGGASFLAMMLLERFAGEMTGSPPGNEMVRAVEAARAVGSRVELVDLPILLTVASLRKLPLKEKVRLGVDSLLSIMLLPFGSLSFSKLTEDIDSQIRVFRHRCPELSRLLLDVREEHMVRRIRDIMDSTTGQVVAVVGFGHMKSLARALAPIQERHPFSARITWQLTTGAMIVLKT